MPDGETNSQAGPLQNTQHGEIPWISPSDVEVVSSLLTKAEILQDGESVETVCRAGEGNMNSTLRVVTNRRSVVVKQSRPWVEKYPSIAAPVNRIDFERQFYEVAASWPDVARRMPALLAALPDYHLIVLEDLGPARDGTPLYTSPGTTNVLPAFIDDLVAWLATLHDRSTNETDRLSAHQNRDLRQLNHEHLFRIPLADPPALDLDALTPGLADIAADVRRQTKVGSAFAELGRRYLADGPCLLHGDFFPGSWLFCEDGPRVIDPEFSFWEMPNSMSRSWPHTYG